MGMVEDTKDQEAGIVSLQFAAYGPIGALLASYDSGKIRVWQAHIKNE